MQLLLMATLKEKKKYKNQYFKKQYGRYKPPSRDICVKKYNNK